MKIIGKSKAIYGTWFFVPTYNVLFDCGDGAGSSLGIHSADIQHIFISHTHLDHIAGIPTILRFQKRVLKREPNRQVAAIYYHKNQEKKINDLRNYLETLSLKTKFVLMEKGKDVQISKLVYVRSFEVDHSANYYHQKLPAFGFHLIEKRTRLKKEYLKEIEKIQNKFNDTKNLKQEIANFMIKIKKEKGKSELNENYEVKLLSYCGDSRPVDYNEVLNTNILMHEATFLNKDEIEAAHSCVPEVLDLAKKSNCKSLIMYHLSEKYKREQRTYKADIMEMAKKKKLEIPVYPVGVDDFFYKEV